MALILLDFYCSFVIISPFPSFSISSRYIRIYCVLFIFLLISFLCSTIVLLYLLISL
jgi:hypothetical protein